MKAFLRMFLLVTVVVVGLVSCSSTRNAIGIDTINGFIRTGKWTTLTKEVYATGSNTALKTDVLADGKYLEFKADNKAHIYDANAAEVSSVNYNFLDTKTMVYDGLEYKVQENFVSTISVMTLINQSATEKTILTFRR